MSCKQDPCTRIRQTEDTQNRDVRNRTFRQYEPEFIGTRTSAIPRARNHSTPTTYLWSPYQPACATDGASIARRSPTNHRRSQRARTSPRITTQPTIRIQRRFDEGLRFFIGMQIVFGTQWPHLYDGCKQDHLHPVVYEIWTGSRMGRVLEGEDTSTRR